MSCHDSDVKSCRESHMDPAAAQNAIDEHGCRDASIPDDSIYRGVPQWDGPRAVQAPAQTNDGISDIIVPEQGDIMSEVEDWRDKLVDGLNTETARQIAKQRREARAKGTRPRVSFTATLSSALVEDDIMQSLVERLEQHGWTVTHDFNSENPEFTVHLD
ncbi:MAG: hypothetical protein WBP12_03905 [Candidatus Saccharimonas sp.]